MLGLGDFFGTVAATLKRGLGSLIGKSKGDGEGPSPGEGARHPAPPKKKPKKQAEEPEESEDIPEATLAPPEPETPAPEPNPPAPKAPTAQPQAPPARSGRDENTPSGAPPAKPHKTETWDDELAGYMGGEEKSLASSNLSSSKYNSKEKYMEIGFTGGKRYGYHDVSGQEATNFFTSKSKGSWVWDHLRRRGTKFGYQKSYAYISGESKADSKKPKYYEDDTHREEHRAIGPGGDTPDTWKAGKGPYKPTFGLPKPTWGTVDGMTTGKTRPHGKTDDEVKALTHAKVPMAYHAPAKEKDDVKVPDPTPPAPKAPQVTHAPKQPATSTYSPPGGDKDDSPAPAKSGQLAGVRSLVGKGKPKKGGRHFEDGGEDPEGGEFIVNKESSEKHAGLLAEMGGRPIGGDPAVGDNVPVQTSAGEVKATAGEIMVPKEEAAKHRGTLERVNQDKGENESLVGEPGHLVDGGVTGKDKDDYSDALYKEYSKQHNTHAHLPFLNLSKEEKRALTIYRGLGADTNHFLRTGENDQPYIREDIKTLDGLMGRYKLPKMDVYRGGLIPGAGKNNKNIMNLVGRSFVDFGYVSTSTDPKVAENFLGDGQVRQTIHIPKDTPGISLNGVNSDADNWDDYEHEVLLDRNSEFKINKVEKAPDQKYNVDLDLIPNKTSFDYRGLKTKQEGQHKAQGGFVGQSSPLQEGVEGGASPHIGRGPAPAVPAGMPSPRQEHFDKGGPTGKTKTHPQTETKDFKEWFGDSKVVDEDGKPKRVFHGTFTQHDFDEFRTTSKNELGAHFGDVDQSSDFSFGEKGRTYPSFLSMKNPLRLEDRGAWSDKDVIPQLIDAGIGTSVDDEDKTPHELIRNAGYDGVVYLNRREGLPSDARDRFSSGSSDFKGVIKSQNEADMMSDEEFKKVVPEARDSYIALRPNQIKSAIGNSGEFNPDDPRIHKAQGGFVGQPSPSKSHLHPQPLQESRGHFEQGGLVGESRHFKEGGDTENPIVSTGDLASHITKDERTKDLDDVRVRGYRVGKTGNPLGRGDFFAGNKAGADAYKSTHLQEGVEGGASPHIGRGPAPAVPAGMPSPRQEHFADGGFTGKKKPVGINTLFQKGVEWRGLKGKDLANAHQEYANEHEPTIGPELPLDPTNILDDEKNGRDYDSDFNLILNSSEMPTETPPHRRVEDGPTSLGGVEVMKPHFAKGGDTSKSKAKIPEPIPYVDEFGEGPHDNPHSRFRHEQANRVRSSVKRFLGGEAPIASRTHEDYSAYIMTGGDELFTRKGDARPAPGEIHQGFHDPDVKEVTGVGKEEYDKPPYLELDAQVQAVKYGKKAFTNGRFEDLWGKPKKKKTKKTPDESNQGWLPSYKERNDEGEPHFALGGSVEQSQKHLADGGDTRAGAKSKGIDIKGLMGAVKAGATPYAVYSMIPPEQRDGGTQALVKSLFGESKPVEKGTTSGYSSRATDAVGTASGYSPPKKSKKEGAGWVLSDYPDLQSDLIGAIRAGKSPSEVHAMIPQGLRGSAAPSLLKQMFAMNRPQGQHFEKGGDTKKDASGENFQKWFGDSKVVDEEGKPKTVYHGRTKEFDAFAKDSKIQNGSLAGKGFYFAEQKKMAESYNDPDKPELMVEANLAIKNPFDFDRVYGKKEIQKIGEAGLSQSNFSREWFDEDPRLAPETVPGNDLWRTVFSSCKGNNDTTNKIFEEAGYDGIVHSSRDERHGDIADTHRGEKNRGGRVWVAFNPNQIKSTSNSGEYNPDDPNIHRAHGGMTGQGEGDSYPQGGGEFIVNKKSSEKHRGLLEDLGGKEIHGDPAVGDNVPVQTSAGEVRTTAGEFILPEESAKKNRGLLEEVNQDKGGGSSMFDRLPKFPTSGKTGPRHEAGAELGNPVTDWMDKRYGKKTSAMAGLFGQAATWVGSAGLSLAMSQPAILPPGSGMGVSVAAAEMVRLARGKGNKREDWNTEEHKAQGGMVGQNPSRGYEPQQGSEPPAHFALGGSVGEDGGEPQHFALGGSVDDERDQPPTNSNRNVSTKQEGSVGVGSILTSVAKIIKVMSEKIDDKQAGQMIGGMIGHKLVGGGIGALLGSVIGESIFGGGAKNAQDGQQGQGSGQVGSGATAAPSMVADRLIEAANLLKESARQLMDAATLLNPSPALGEPGSTHDWEVDADGNPVLTERIPKATEVPAPSTYDLVPESTPNQPITGTYDLAPTSLTGTPWESGPGKSTSGKSPSPTTAAGASGRVEGIPKNASATTPPPLIPSGANAASAAPAAAGAGGAGAGAMAGMGGPIGLALMAAEALKKGIETVRDGLYGASESVQGFGEGMAQIVGVPKSIAELGGSLFNLFSPLRLLGNLVGSLANPFEALKSGFAAVTDIIGKTVSVFMDMRDPSALIRSATTPFQSQVAAYSPASIDRFNLALDNLSAAMGYIFEPIIDGARGFADELNSLFTAIGPDLRAAVTSFVQPMVGFGRSVMLGFASGLQQLSVSLGPVVSSFLTLGPTVGAWIGGIGGLAGTLAHTLTPAFTTLVDATKNVTAYFMAMGTTIGQLSDRFAQTAVGQAGGRVVNAVNQFRDNETNTRIRNSINGFLGMRAANLLPGFAENFRNARAQLDLQGQPIGGAMTYAAQPARHVGIEQVGMDARAAAFSEGANIQQQQLDVQNNMAAQLRDMAALLARALPGLGGALNNLANGGIQPQFGGNN